MNRKIEYEEYLGTDKWNELRSTRLAIDNYECVLCGNKAEIVHHRRYPEVFGTETVKDLVSLCDNCHSFPANSR